MLIRNPLVILAAMLLMSVTSTLHACMFCTTATQRACCPFRTSTDGDESEDVGAFRTSGLGWTANGTSAGVTDTNVRGTFIDGVYQLWGTPVELTWSVVPDGTDIPPELISAGESDDPSDLIAFLDGIHHDGASPGGSDLTQRTWHGMIESAFERWEEISGITYDYEPNDDASSLPNGGIENVRGDHRLGGHYIDGNGRPSILAYNYFPFRSDMVIDTSERGDVLGTGILDNPENNYIRFRNMIAHEIGHGLGLNHLESYRDEEGDLEGTFLMEPFLSTQFDGPQFDDILAVHRLYGDALEKNGGNDSADTATDLGHLSFMSELKIGSDADDEYVAPDETDFVSIDDVTDEDFYSFTITSPKEIRIAVEPKGPTYPHSPSFFGSSQLAASELADLSIALLAMDGSTVIELQNTPGLGFTEIIEDIRLTSPGEYFVRIGSTTAQAQLYELTIASVPEPSAAASLLLAVCGSLLFWRSRL